MSTSVVRAMQILGLLARSDKPLNLTPIAEALDIPKSTAHKILRDLVSERFVAVAEPSAYGIGLKAFEVGSAHLRATGAVGVVAPELVRLTRTLNITSHYAVLDAADAVYLCKEDPPGLGVQLASSIGARLPAHLTAVGKACLAWLPDDVVDLHFDNAASKQPTARLLATLKTELAAVRQAGYATDDGVAAAGIQCVAAPVFDMSGPRGAIGTSFLMGLYEGVEQIAGEVTGAAARVTALLGGTPTP
jgi:DNA-binding IclR family transcriptional regulator